MADIRIHRPSIDMDDREFALVARARVERLSEAVEVALQAPTDTEQTPRRINDVQRRYDQLIEWLEIGLQQ